MPHGLGSKDLGGANPGPQASQKAASARLVRPQAHCQKETVIPLLLIERNFAEQLEVNRHSSMFTRVNADVSIQWLYSFLTVDKKKP